MTLYSLNLARAVHECRTPPFDTMHYTPERLRQLRYAGLLHDVGKIGVREYILCKADKLPENGVNLIRARLELLAERALANTLEQAIKECSDPGPLLAERYAPLKLQIDQALALVEAKNKPGFVKDEELAALADLKARGWLTAKEHELLSVRKGNLTASEWDDMRSHVTKSYQILLRIPWPAALGETPEVAYTHHEKRDGIRFAVCGCSVGSTCTRPLDTTSNAASATGPESSRGSGASTSPEAPTTSPSETSIRTRRRGFCTVTRTALVAEARPRRRRAGPVISSRVSKAARESARSESARSGSASAESVPRMRSMAGTARSSDQTSSQRTTSKEAQRRRVSRRMRRISS